MGNPLGSVVDTPLILKLKRLAFDLINGTPGTPRWIFLVGGPGNGKSRAVEAFVQELDSLAKDQDELANTVRRKFAPNTVTPRSVKVLTDELAGAVLPGQLRRLILIQDASAVDGPDQHAEDHLIHDLADLVTSPPGQEPVFVCCANRGLIARARSAIQVKKEFGWLKDSEITRLLEQLLKATGLGPDALASSRLQCWPLEDHVRFAAWPLDLDSIIRLEPGRSPLEQMLSVATDEQQWQGRGSCGDCRSRGLCPFYTNAAMLRGEKAGQALTTLLRHGEMATGHRWNFRDAFSLCAELIVGHRDDFELDDGTVSPCSWVHERADELSLGAQPSRKMSAAWELAFQLYSQSLFPAWPDPGEDLDTGVVERSSTTKAAVQVFSQGRRSEATQVRHLLVGAFSQRLDPSGATPSGNDSLLRKVEDAFGQSVKQGSETFKGNLTPSLEQLLDLMAQAEADWSTTGGESRKVRKILESLRILSSTLVKRFLGVREGEYLNREPLLEYEALTRDVGKLREVVQPLRSVLAPDMFFGGSLVRVYGQPLPDQAKDVRVTAPLGSVVSRVAPRSTDERPGHDLPWMSVEKQSIPLTFDLFVALRASADGVAFASFAPHTRAAIDKVKNAIAGRLSRDKERMLGGEVLFKVGELGLLVPGENGTLKFSKE